MIATRESAFAHVSASSWGNARARLESILNANLGLTTFQTDII